MKEGTLESKDVSAVLTGLLDVFSADHKAAYAKVRDIPLLQKAVEAARSGDVDAFHAALLRPMDKLVNGLLQAEFPGNFKLHFLLQHRDFVEGQFKKIIITKDGPGCTKDKSGWLMDELARFFLTGEEIVIAHTEKSFCLPENVFCTHDSIVGFFDAVHRLYAGQPDVYLKALAKLLVPPKAAV